MLADTPGLSPERQGLVRSLLDELDAAIGALRSADTGLQLLSEASSRLGASLEVEETLPAFATLMVPDYADWCLLHLGNGGEGGGSSDFRLAAAAARTARATRFLQARAARLSPPSQTTGPLGRAMATGRPQLLQEISGEVLSAVLPDVAPRAIPSSVAAGSAILVPVTIRGATVGLLTLARGGSRAPFGPPDLPLVELLARRVALAVDNARLYREARLARQEAERRASQLAEFVRMITHDVQQPLSAAQWHLQAMRRALDRGDVSGARLSEEAIEVAAQRLDAMVRDLAESARLEMGSANLNLQATDLSALVAEVVRSLGADAGRIRLDLRPTRPVLVDPGAFPRVIGNLVGNALKYSDPDTVVRVELRQEGDEAILAVADRGIGVSPEELPRLFDRGYRASGASQKAEGLGMGLYISRLLVQAHGGRIWATSEPGQGSTFYVALPTPPS